MTMEVATTATIRRDVASSERTWRNRTNCLEANTKMFTPILQVLHSLKVDLFGVLVPYRFAKSLPRRKPFHRSHRHNVITQDSRAIQFGKLGILVMTKNCSIRFAWHIIQVFLGATWRVQHRYGHVVCWFWHESSDIGWPLYVVHSGYVMLLAAGAKVAKPKVETKPQLAPAVSNAVTVTGQQKRVSRTPIIIIPAASTSMISMYNVKDLLQVCF